MTNTSILIVKCPSDKIEKNVFIKHKSDELTIIFINQKVVIGF